MDIKPGNAWIDKSTSDGNHKGENANEEGMYGFVIDREGNHDDEKDNDILANRDCECWNLFVYCWMLEAKTKKTELNTNAL